MTVVPGTGGWSWWNSDDPEGRNANTFGELREESEGSAVYGKMCVGVVVSMWKIRVFCISLAGLCLASVAVDRGMYAGDEYLFGTIDITITGRGHTDQNGGENGPEKWHSSYDHSLSAGCHIVACGDQTLLNVLAYDPYGTENWNKRFSMQRDHNTCEEIWKGKAYIARPGDSEEMTETFEAGMEKPVYVSQEKPRVELGEEPNGRYSLTVSGQLEMLTFFDSGTTHHYACGGKDVKTVIQSSPEAPAKTTQDEDGSTFMSGPSTPKIIPIYVAALNVRLKDTMPLYNRIDEDNGYTETATASWHFIKTQTPCDCDAIVNIARGDVKVNGAPTTEGNILEDPQEISTGAGSRARITFGDGTQINLGSNNRMDLGSLCRESGGSGLSSVYMRINSLLAVLTGRKAVIHMEGSNAVTGSRGELLPAPWVPRPSIRLASYVRSAVGLPAASFVENELTELTPGVGDIERSAAAFIVQYRGSGFNVWALKGQLNLKDSNGSSTVLRGKVNAGAAQLPTPHHVKAKWITIQVSE
jgi:hypothetical protein